MKKKITSVISLLLCAALALSLTACGGVSGNDKKMLEEAFKDTVMGGSFDEEAVEKVEDIVESKDFDVYYDSQQNFHYIYSKSVQDVEALGYVIHSSAVLDFDGDGFEEIFIIGSGRTAGKKIIACCDYIRFPGILGGEQSFVDAHIAEMDESLDLRFEIKNNKIYLVSDNFNYGEIIINGVGLEFSNCSPLSAETQDKNISIFRDTDSIKFRFDGTEFNPGNDFMYQMQGLDVYFKLSKLEEVSGLKVSEDFRKGNSCARMLIYGEEYIHLLCVADYLNISPRVENDEGAFDFMTEDYAAAHPVE